MIKESDLELPSLAQHKEDTVNDIISSKYNDLSIQEKLKLHEIFLNTQTLDDIKQKIEKIIFIKPPPSPENFLNPDNLWLPRKIRDSLYPNVLQDFLNITNPKNNFFQIVFYGAQRTGKSYCTRLLMYYTIVFLHHLRDPGCYYGLSSISSLAMYLISYKFDKTKQLYLAPLYKWLEASERFVRVKYQDQVKKDQAKLGIDKIVWSSAATAGEITLNSGLQILLGNDNPNEIVGADTIAIFITEIAQWIKEDGISEDDIFELYTNAYNRINSTVGNKYLAYLLLDSSAFRTDSKIEQHIIKNLQFNKETYFTWRNQWEVQGKKLVKTYSKEKQKLLDENIPQEQLDEVLVNKGYAFKVITGNGDFPSQIITKKEQLENVPKDLIITVPIDLKDSFEVNLVTCIRDIAGKPTSNESKFIQPTSLISNIWDYRIKNIEGGVQIDSGTEPKGLIWGQIHSKFFNSLADKYYFYRAPNATRYIGIDVAHSSKNDPYGFGVVHKEFSKNLNSEIYIIDMNFVLLPGKNGINMVAVEEFILDLRNLGNMDIGLVAGDTYYIANAKQNLKDRNNIEVITQSVDTTMNPYQYLYACILQNKIKGGKNIFLKNNLSCLERVTTDKGVEKIEHPKGKVNHQYFNDWDLSGCGLNEKDASDGLVQALWAAYNDKRPAGIIYEEENKKFSNNPDDLKDILDKAYNRLHMLSPKQNITNNKQISLPLLEVIKN